MAILAGIPGLPDLEVTVQSAGQALPEYPFTPEDARNEWPYSKFGHLAESSRSATYLQCTSGDIFAIKLAFKLPCTPRPNQDIGSRISVDGNSITRVGIPYHRIIAILQNGGVIGVFGTQLKRTSPTQARKHALKFNAINKVDDCDSARVEQDAKLIRDIGIIAVAAYHAHATNNIRKVRLPIGMTPTVDEIAEKALKGMTLSHGVSFVPGAEVDKAPSPRMHIPSGRDNPLAAFVFKYRSREALQSELVIPRSPSSSPQPIYPARNTNRENAPASRDQRLANLKKEIAEIEAEQSQETQSQESQASQKRTREDDFQSGRANKSRKSNSSIVIDLTDD